MYEALHEVGCEAVATATEGQNQIFGKRQSTACLWPRWERWDGWAGRSVRRRPGPGHLRTELGPLNPWDPGLRMARTVPPEIAGKLPSLDGGKTREEGVSKLKK